MNEPDHFDYLITEPYRIYLLRLRNTTPCVDEHTLYVSICDPCGYIISAIAVFQAGSFKMETFVSKSNNEYFFDSS